MKKYLIFRNNMNSLFTNHYFDTKDDCHSYMKFHWPSQKYHVQEIAEMPKSLISRKDEKIFDNPKLVF